MWSMPLPIILGLAIPPACIDWQFGPYFSVDNLHVNTLECSTYKDESYYLDTFGTRESVLITKVS